MRSMIVYCNKHNIANNNNKTLDIENCETISLLQFSPIILLLVFSLFPVGCTRISTVVHTRTYTIIYNTVCLGKPGLIHAQARAQTYRPFP